MLEDFSSKAGKYLAIAESLAFDLGHCNVGSEHLLLSFLKLKDCKLKRLLEVYKIDFDKVKKELQDTFETKDELPFYMEYTDALKDILLQAKKLSKSLNEDKVSEDCLMRCLVKKDDCLAREILIKYGCDIGYLLSNLEVNKISLLDSVEELTNLNKKMMANPMHVYKRELEIKMIENTLLKKQKANVLIVGEAGVGKSALVEGLATNIVNGNVNEYLKDKIIYELDLASIVAGTKYRGEFEEKLKKILGKVKNEKNAILFIDEIHNIIGAGGAEGAIDASNILKPYLARKDLSVIGATTYDEYVKLIEKEKAIERRFMILKLDEVSVKDTKEIMIKIKEEYCGFHHVAMSDFMVEKLVELLDKYVKEKRFPDKAIDALDYTLVISKNKGHNEVEISDLNEAIHELFKVNIGKLNLERAKEKIKEKIVGQDDAIERVFAHLKLANMGLKDGNKPIGIYLFLGEPGVGKTELAKQISKYYFLRDDSYIKLEMESFSEPGSVSKILGANPGYVGYDSDSFLSEKVRMNPSSVIILDEIEKANKEVINLFLNVFDEGYLIDSRKRRIDFTNTIIIMTSNLGFSNQKESIGFNKSVLNNEDLEMLVKRFFKEEFLNRIDEIVCFKHLENDSYQLIANNYLNEFNFETCKEDIFNRLDTPIKGVRDLKRKIKKEIIKEVKESMEINS